VNLSTTENTTALRSHRPSEAIEHYLQRLARGRLTRPELREIDTIYARLDVESAVVGLPSAERAPWSPVDILEWQDLTATERYLDLKGYADASDRAARSTANHLLAA